MGIGGYIQIKRIALPIEPPIACSASRRPIQTRPYSLPYLTYINLSKRILKYF